MAFGQFNFETTSLTVFPSVRHLLSVQTPFVPAEGFAISLHARNVRSVGHGFNITKWSP